MTDETRSATRRQFLKTAAAASGSVLLLGVGCADEDGVDGQDSGVDDGSRNTRDDIDVFSSGKIGHMQLKNRLVRSATCECLAFGGKVSDEYLNIFRALAAGGVGMIISGNTSAVESDSNPLVLQVFDDSCVDGLKTVKDTVASVDPECKLIGQIVHSGNLIAGATRTGPSDISWPGDTKPMTPLSVEEIRGVVQDFAEAARRFKEAGWDGVEIHGAHGYLLSSFLSPYTNNRTDEYGGSVENRVRIVREVIEETRRRVGDDFPILIKLNSSDSGDYVGVGFEGGIDKQLFLETAGLIGKMGVDAIDVSGNNWIENDVDEPEEQSFFEDAAETLDVDVPVILTGGNRSFSPLQEIMKKGKVDFLGIARPLVREPDLPNKWQSGETTTAKCISCNMCYYNIISGLRCHQEPSQ